MSSRMIAVPLIVGDEPEKAPCVPRSDPTWADRAQPIAQSLAVSTKGAGQLREQFRGVLAQSLVLDILSWMDFNNWAKFDGVTKVWVLTDVGRAGIVHG